RELSFAQERLWFLEQWNPGSRESSVGVAWRVEGPLEVTFLQTALDELVARHESLRTMFSAVVGRPQRAVAPPAGVPLQVAEIDDIAVAEDLARDELTRRFDLAAAPLFRARLLRLGPRDHLLVLVLPRIVADDASLEVLARELGTFYRGL